MVEVGGVVSIDTDFTGALTVAPLAVIPISSLVPPAPATTLSVSAL